MPFWSLLNMKAKMVAALSLIGLCLATYGGENGRDIEIKVPKAVAFLPIPVGMKIRIQEGILEASKAGQ